MPYSPETQMKALSKPFTTGKSLLRWAIKLDFPVTSIAQYTGATRQTIYNWLDGTEVSPAYRERVTALLSILQSSKTVEEAMRKCTPHT